MSILRQITPVLILLAACSLMQQPARAAAKRIALLVGVGEYQESRDQTIRSLEGPPHDVAAMKAVLTDKWGFKAGDIHTLVDGEATRKRILAEIDALYNRSQPGDVVFLYLSGHGTSDRDYKAGLPLPHTSGAFLPADFPAKGSTSQQLSNIIIGQRDIRPRLEVLEKGGRLIYVAYDSCFSGNAVRSISGLASRHVSLASRGGQDEIEMSADLGNRPEPPPFPYRQVFFLSAASDNERAADIGRDKLSIAPTVDGKPHGAFTDALLRVLQQPQSADIDRNGNLTNGELYEAVASFMDQRSYGHHPQMLPSTREDRQGLSRWVVFATQRDNPTQPPQQVHQPAHGQTTSQAAQSVRVKVEADDRDAQARQMRQQLSGLSGVQLVDADPDYLLRLQAGRKQSPSWRLLTPNGDTVTNGEDDDVDDMTDIPERLKAEVWWRKLQAIVQTKRSFTLALEANPASRGGTFVEGETLVFDLRSEHAGQLLLLNLDAKGKVTVLYPSTVAELKALPAGKLLVIPGEGPQDRIEVKPPFGTDQLLALVFPQGTPMVDNLRGMSKVSVDSPALTRLATVMESGTAFGATSYRLRTLSSESAKQVSAKP